MAFDHDITNPLHDLAAELLAKRQYGRLVTVTHYLSVLSTGQWSRPGSDEQKLFVDKMASDFHPRAWDDWEWDTDGALSRLIELIVAQVRACS